MAVTLKAISDSLVPFGKAERVIAGICMAMPFLLVIADQGDPAYIPPVKVEWWVYIIVALVAIGLPTFIVNRATAYKTKYPKSNAFRTALLTTFFLVVLYIVFAFVLDFRIRDSISAFVGMTPGSFFGCLLTIPSMLFIANAFVHWQEAENKGGKHNTRRSRGNFYLGVTLLLVVLFPCNSSTWIVQKAHYLFALCFFIGCGVVVANGSEDDKRTNWLMVSILAVSFGLWGLCHIWPQSILKYVTLFGVECIALWVVGVRYILNSVADGK